MKCLPAVKLPLAQGVTLHDWHAEVLAIRAFNYFVLEECMSIVCGRRPSDFIQLREVGDADLTDGIKVPFAWTPDISLHMYCSEAPCESVILQDSFRAMRAML